MSGGWAGRPRPGFLVHSPSYFLQRGARTALSEAKERGLTFGWCKWWRLFQFLFLEQENNFSGVKTVARHHNVTHTRIIYDDSPNTVVLYAVHAIKWASEREGSMKSLTARTGPGLEGPH